MSEEKQEIATLTSFEINLVAAAESCEVARKEVNHTIQALKLAKGLSDLKKALLAPQVLAIIKEFMNSPMGFLTDKDPSKSVKNKKTGNWENPAPYSDSVVVECLADAMSKGLTIHNNEFNIIAGRMYPAQSGFVRKLQEFKREHSIKANYLPSIPVFKGGSYYCEVVAWWQKPNEKREEAKLSWNITAFSEDAALGKVKKRANEWLFNELTGNTWSSSEDFHDFSEVNNKGDIEMDKEVKVFKITKEAAISAFVESKDMNELKAKWDMLKERAPDLYKDPEVLAAKDAKKTKLEGKK